MEFQMFPKCTQYRSHIEIDVFMQSLNAQNLFSKNSGVATCTSTQGFLFGPFPVATVASFTKEVDPRLVKRPLVFNGRSANRGLTSWVKEANVVS